MSDIQMLSGAILLTGAFALGAIFDAAVDQTFEAEAQAKVQIMPGKTVPLVYLDKGLFTVRGLFNQWQNRHHSYCPIDLTTEPLMEQLIRMTSVIQNCNGDTLTYRSHNGGNYVLLSGSETSDHLP